MMAAVACPYNDLGNPEPSILKPDFSLHHLNLNLKPQTLFQYLKVQWLSIFSSQELVERYHIYIPLHQYSLPASPEICRAIKVRGINVHRNSAICGNRTWGNLLFPPKGGGDSNLPTKFCQLWPLSIWSKAAILSSCTERFCFAHFQKSEISR